MKKVILSFIWLIFIFSLNSCSKNDTLESMNSKLNQELLTLKEEHNKLKQDIEILKENNKNIKTNNEEVVQKIENNPETSVNLEEDIKLAWCEETKKVWNVEWCMKNSELIKDVDWYETRFSKSVQNDSWFKWIYETDNEDKLYTFEYLQKACWIIEWEWLITDKNMKKSCPCPTWYHIPTTKEWRDTYSFYKENVNLFKSELLFPEVVWTRDSKGSIYKNIWWINKYHTSNLATSSDKSYVAHLTEKEVYLSDYGEKIYDAYALRCVKNN